MMLHVALLPLLAVVRAGSVVPGVSLRGQEDRQSLQPGQPTEKSKLEHPKGLFQGETGHAFRGVDAEEAPKKAPSADGKAGDSTKKSADPVYDAPLRGFGPSEEHEENGPQHNDLPHEPIIVEESGKKASAADTGNTTQESAAAGASGAEAGSAGDIWDSGKAPESETPVIETPPETPPEALTPPPAEVTPEPLTNEEGAAAGVAEPKKKEGKDGMEVKPGAGLPTGRGGSRLAQPWIFSVIMIGILITFCGGVCLFARYAKRSFRKTEDELRELLEKLKSSSMQQLMEEHAPGTPTPVPILRARHLVKKAKDDQVDHKRNHRRQCYKEVRDEIMNEMYKLRKGKSKEELLILDDEIRTKLAQEKERIRAATIKDWAEGRLEDPVPSLPEAEAWLIKMEVRWKEMQMAST